MKGVGPHRAELLERLNLRTVADALGCFPRRYEDRRHLLPLARLREGQVQATSGEVWTVAAPPRGRRRAPVRAGLRDASGVLSAVWFNQPYLAQVLKRGQRLVLYGKVTRQDGGRGLEMRQPEFEVVEEEDASVHMGRIVPIYPLTEGLTQRPMRTLLHRLVEQVTGAMPEPLPPPMLTRLGLPEAHGAYRSIHFPASLEEADAARRRFVFEDFLLLQLGLAIRRRRRGVEPGRVLAPPGALVARLRAALPFELTPAQRRVWEEIRVDLGRPTPMNRLLQGDVGSGKTVVAGMALLLAVEAGYQGVLMAPTEILAEQHAHTLSALLEPTGVQVALLASG
ncbi:MAG TPA: DEAD/DEAH box helicase, partial [Methylomirabilota bacterium]|nr:DEAD/DEAH box helicase [Methylomirabilota bacterium]